MRSVKKLVISSKTLGIAPYTVSSVSETFEWNNEVKPAERLGRKGWTVTVLIPRLGDEKVGILVTAKENPLPNFNSEDTNRTRVNFTGLSDALDTKYIMANDKPTGEFKLVGTATGLEEVSTFNISKKSAE